MRTHDELDLTDANATQGFFETEQPDYVFLAAGKVGGIHANNSFSAEFLRENLLIQTHVMHKTWKIRSKETAISWKLMHLSKVCATANFRNCISDW